VFTGIIEGKGQTQTHDLKDRVLSVEITRPSHFDDLKTGDSVCCNGVCLTVVRWNDQSVLFDLGPETLKITSWDQSLPKIWNMERSLRYGDRVHGHLVTGHVDHMGELVGLEKQGESLVMTFALPIEAMKTIVPKGSLCIHGVSLTLNSVEEDTVSVCLIPETLKRTNLGDLSLGDKVTIETDYFLKGLLCTTQKN